MEFRSVRTVLPGDLVSVEASDIILGPGLMQNEESIICTKAGVLMKKENSWFIDSDQKRYIPATGENVVGRIIGKVGEVYRVDIGSAHQALLPFLAFENATKKNRPALNIGDLVYARISLANRDIDPEIQCTNLDNKADGFGELKKGFMLKCSLRYCRRLFSLKTQIMESLDKKLTQKGIEIEVAIGLNGRIWFCTEKVKHAIVFYNALKEAETMSDAELLEILFSLKTQIMESLDKKLTQKGIEIEVAIGLNGRIWFCTEKVKHAIVFYNALKEAETMSDAELLEMFKNLDRKF
ncbi:hypothetical protein Glove_120g76 [Diversispora epigaea]|uniref:Ribosomal RNA-processing protein 40 n=1 Tax=Diversispora epigaea TaxID=1348612 RepID=A0A397J3X5_9GLOM|nr:hypothetical protein Glove_120g76 [Diversispora epigaea]